MSVICEHPAPGTSTIFFGATGRAVRVRCDTLGHRIVVTDEDGQVLKVFGEHGRRSGCLDTPLDVVCVRPEFAGDAELRGANVPSTVPVYAPAAPSCAGLKLPGTSKLNPSPKTTCALAAVALLGASATIDSTAMSITGASPCLPLHPPPPTSASRTSVANLIRRL